MLFFAVNKKIVREQQNRVQTSHEFFFNRTDAEFPNV